MRRTGHFEAFCAFRLFRIIIAAQSVDSHAAILNRSVSRNCRCGLCPMEAETGYELAQ